MAILKGEGKATVQYHFGLFGFVSVDEPRIKTEALSSRTRGVLVALSMRQHLGTMWIMLWLFATQS